MGCSVAMGKVRDMDNEDLIPETPDTRSEAAWWSTPAQPSVPTQAAPDTADETYNVATPHTGDFAVAGDAHDQTRDSEPAFPGGTLPLRHTPMDPERKRRLSTVGALAAVSLVSGGLGAVIANSFDHTSNTSGGAFLSAAAPVSNTGDSPTEQLAKVAAAVQPSVVSIKVVSQTISDEGTGVVLKSDGTILTNNHVIAAAADGAGTITVKFSDGRSASAKLLGRDASVDLAVIKATGISDARPATLGSSTALHVGDTVLAIGSPLGLEGSVSAGIVSALHRTVQLQSDTQQNPLNNFFGQQQQTPTQTASVGDAIQTDAAINPGNSGGPLVDNQGRVIGINTAIASVGTSAGQSGNIGVGFAIPIDEAKSVVAALSNGQTPEHAILGVQITDDTNGGALIGTVSSGSGAAKAGLKAGDVVTKIDNTTVDDGNGLIAIIRSHRPGDTVTIYYTRAGKPGSVKVVLGAVAT